MDREQFRAAAYATIDDSMWLSLEKKKEEKEVRLTSVWKHYETNNAY